MSGAGKIEARRRGKEVVMSKILLVSGEKGTLSILANLLKTEGFKTVSTQDRRKLPDMAKDEGLSLLIFDAAAANDLETLAAVRSFRPNLPVILIIKGNSAEMAAAAQSAGAFAIMEKPLKVDKLLAEVQKAVDFSDSALTQSVNLNLQLEAVYPFEEIVAESPAMRSVCDMLSRVAPTDITVLLIGDKGTGKETIARAIHARSRRKDKPFVTVRCDNSVEAEQLLKEGGPIEAANGGSVLFREVEALPIQVQESLAVALQERKHPSTGKPIDIRIMASSRDSIDPLVARGKFSSSLHKMLRVIVIKIPPLKARKEDIMPTVRAMLRKLLGEDKALPSLDPAVVEAFEAYDWPENARSVEAVLKEALKNASGNRILLENLPLELRAG